MGNRLPQNHIGYIGTVFQTDIPRPAANVVETPGYLQCHGFSLQSLFELPRYLQDPNIALFSVGVMSVWRWLGFVIVLLMAGLSSIPETNLSGLPRT